ncbi:hypothetical protein KEM56_004271, partial [Ascosphaera pollenicola]
TGRTPALLSPTRSLLSRSLRPRTDNINYSEDLPPSVNVVLHSDDQPIRDLKIPLTSTRRKIVEHTWPPELLKKENHVYFNGRERPTDSSQNHAAILAQISGGVAASACIKCQAGQGPKPPPPRRRSPPPSSFRPLPPSKKSLRPKETAPRF